MTAGNQPLSSGTVDALAKIIWLAEFERAFSRIPRDPWENQADSSKEGHRNTAQKIIDAGFVHPAQCSVGCGNLTFGAPVENIAASDRNPIKRGIFIRKTSAKMAEYATKEGCHSTPLDNLRADPSVSSTTRAGAATKHSGTFLGYRDEHGNEMHCAHAFCPHQAKCHKGCTNPVAMTSTNRDGFGNKLCPKCSLPHSEFADCPAMAPADCGGAK